MKQQDVLKKLESVVETKRAALLKDAKSESRQRDKFSKINAKRLLGEAARLNRRTVSGLTYKISDNYFSNGRDTTGFNPETMHAHSYGWYSLADKIKGIMILNTFHYSSQTSIHIGRVSQVLRDLGIKYKTLKAPRGLQSLDKALEYELEMYAERLVREKYGRGTKRKAAYFVDRMRNFSTPEIKLLATLGHKTTRKMRDAALEHAESRRLDKNERLRRRSALKRAAAAIVIVSDFENKLHGATDGLHEVAESKWAWNEETKQARDEKRLRGRSTFQYARERAVSAGLTKIYVHSKEPKHLKLVEEA